MFSASYQRYSRDAGTLGRGDAEDWAFEKEWASKAVRKIAGTRRGLSIRRID
jgi:hypothetical protein